MEWTQSKLLQAALTALDGDELELARRLGYGVNTASRQFARWRKDEGMNFENTIALLQIAGLLGRAP